MTAVDNKISTALVEFVAQTTEVAEQAFDVWRRPDGLLERNRADPRARAR